MAQPSRKISAYKNRPLAFPIYVYLISFAPNQIMQEINREIRKFLWQGGKATNTKKLI